MNKLRFYKRNYCVLFLLVYCILAMVLSGCDLSKAKGRYVSKKFDYSIEFPEGWEMIVEGGGLSVVAISPFENEYDSFDEAIGVIVIEGIGNVRLEEFYRDGLEYLEASYENFYVEDEGNMRINDSKAIWNVYSYDLPDTYVKVLEYNLVRNGRGYVITADAEVSKYDEYIEIFEKSAESFRFE